MLVGVQGQRETQFDGGRVMLDATARGIFLDVPETHHDLLRDPHTGILTTVNGAGRPQATAVFFLVDANGLLKGSVTTDRQKYRNLLRNPSCSLFILDPDNRRRALEIRADAELVPDPEMDVLRQFAARYDMPFETLARSGNQDRVAMILRPRRIVAKSAQ